MCLPDTQLDLNPACSHMYTACSVFKSIGHVHRDQHPKALAFICLTFSLHWLASSLHPACIQPAFSLHSACIQLASKPIRVRSLRRSLFKKLHLSGAIYSRICVERFNFVCPHNQTHSLIVASRSAPSDNAVRLHVAQPLVVKSAV